MYYMRTIVNISLPKEMADELKREVRREGFASTSEFIRTLIREYKRAQLARSLYAQRRQFDQGKGKVLKSLQDWR